jgi:predicted glycoside hydrolase/deacetylase ChbG (UPF0249 family)
MTKYLIITADDFGMSKIFNDVILDIIDKTLVRSTTVMVNKVADNQKEQLEKLIAFSRNRNLSIGLHLEFEHDDYASQIRAQFQKFKDLLGFNPAQVDIHKAHSLTESFPYAAEFCKEIHVPFRNSGARFDGIKTTPSEAFFGSTADFNKIEQWVRTFKDGEFYEILFHPGKYDPECKSSLNKERERDVEHIKKLNSILEKNNIKLVSYLDLASAK